MCFMPTRKRETIQHEVFYFNFDATIPPQCPEAKKNGLNRWAELRAQMRRISTDRILYFPLHSPLLRESWLVSCITLRRLICLSLARILVQADVL